MKKTHRKTSLVAAVVSVLVITLTQSPVAGAVSIAGTQQTLPVVSGNVRVFATATQSFVPTGVALSTTLTNAAKTFFVNNSGNLTLNQFTMTITLPNNSNVSSLKRCALNVAFTGVNTCANAVTPVALTNPVSDSSTVYAFAIPGSGFYSFQITQNKSGTLGVGTSASLQNVTSSLSNS
jgi:hypothetical protein